MKGRLESLGRILQVQRQLHRSAEWQLARLQQQENAVHEDQRQLLGALNEDQALHGLLVQSMARHLRRTSEELETLAKAKAVQAETLRDQAGKLKRTERLRERAAGAHLRATEARDLAELIEAAVGRDASLP
jgi:hypothetical protein